MTEFADIATVLGSRTAAVARGPRPQGDERPATVAVPADVVRSAAADQAPVALRPADRLPEGTVVLRVMRRTTDDGAERFVVTGDCPELPLNDTVSERYGKPDLALAELVSSDGERPGDIVYRLRSWSRSKTELSEWINKLRDRYGDDLRLIIEDQTGWEIPWDLFWLTPGGWLGGLVPMVRRVPVGAGAAAYRQATCSGEVIAFVDDEMSPDRAVLQRYGAWEAGEMNDLLDRLDEEQGGLGLVYVGSHGRWARSATDFTLAGVSAFKLEDGPMNAVKQSNALVFMNACHSMREVFDPRNNDVPRSFARIFLTAGACGVLGTTGLVGLHQARAMAGDLLRRLEVPGTSVAAALRDHRAALAGRLASLSRKQLETAEGKEVLLAFLYSFMYLYIGHPDTTLTVTPVTP